MYDSVMVNLFFSETLSVYNFRSLRMSWGRGFLPSSLLCPHHRQFAVAGGGMAEGVQLWDGCTRGETEHSLAVGPKQLLGVQRKAKAERSQVCCFLS